MWITGGVVLKIATFLFLLRQWHICTIHSCHMRSRNENKPAYDLLAELTTDLSRSDRMKLAQGLVINERLRVLAWVAGTVTTAILIWLRLK